MKLLVHLLSSLLFYCGASVRVFSLLIVAVGVDAQVQKATDTVRDTFLIDPAVILIVVGVVMFFITFCGCIGAPRENIRLLKTFSFSLTLVFLTQLAIAVLGFFYSDQVCCLDSQKGEESIPIISGCTDVNRLDCEILSV